MPADIIAAVLAFLAYPSLWTLTNERPPTICQAAGPVCLIRREHEVLVTQNDEGRMKVTVLREQGAIVVWNEATLRVADAGLLRRDREQREREDARR